MAERRTTSRKRIGLLVTGSALLLMATWLPSQSQTKQPSMTPLEVAEKLDSVVQPLFQETAAFFGTDRMQPAINGHESVRRMDDSRDVDAKYALEGIAEARHDYVIAFLHTVHKPGMFSVYGPKGIKDGIKQIEAPHSPASSFKPSLSLLFLRDSTHRNPHMTYRPEDVEGRVSSFEGGRDRDIRHLQASLETASLKELPKLTKGKSVEVTADNWQVVLRPVLAKQAACLGCHKDAKKGDTLGVMVYAVSKSVTEEKTASAKTASH
ncbi:MAG TPA: hypothetical protein VKU00_10805 [Chthonomonadaceae bacterium]|nr:hypothetical protein [Chthonomonadaceae bacterium]